MFRPIPTDVDFVALEKRRARPVGRARRVRPFGRPARGRATVGLLRGPAHRQRQAGTPPRVGTGLQGPVLPVPDHAGHRVDRRAGWDTHGLPVEVEVEKRLGISGKRQIEEEVGIAEFVRLCRESVVSYVEDWRELTVRIGYWLDFDDAYWTLNPDVHRVGVVAPPPALRPGPALRGHQGRPLLPPVRHRAVQPRAGPARGLPGRRGRVGLRPPAPGRRRPGAGGWRHLAARLDDHPVDAPLQHRGGREPRPHLRGRRRDGGGRAAGGAGDGRGRRGHRTGPRGGPGRPALPPARSTSSPPNPVATGGGSCRPTS